MAAPTSAGLKKKKKEKLQMNSFSFDLLKFDCKI